MVELFLGTIIAGTLNVRSVPTSTGNTPVRTVVKGQHVNASEKVNGWWKLTHIDQIPVTQDLYAFEGNSSGYIQQNAVVQMEVAGLPDMPFRFEIGDNQTYEIQVISGILKPV